MDQFRRAVALVHIEVDYPNKFGGFFREDFELRNRHIVEEAEARA
jgi:hypothetical protein